MIQKHRRIGLSGTLNGVRYRIGAPNPFNRRNYTTLGEIHLRALQTLLGFMDRTHLNEMFVISEREFTSHFPVQDAWSILGALLTCWVRTRNGDETIDSLFASVLFQVDGDRRTVVVTLGERIIPLIQTMMALNPKHESSR